jgi:SlyX protein
MSSDALTTRLAELEARYMLQQDLVDKLSEELFRQQREIDGLGARLAVLEGRVTTLDEVKDEPADEAPPHY